MTSNEYNDSNLIQNNGFIYVAGYFARKVLKKHKCFHCETNLKSFLDPENQNQVYINKRQYDDLDFEKGLCCPSAGWVNYIKEIEDIFIKHFQNNRNEQNVLFKIYQKIKEIKIFGVFLFFVLLGSIKFNKIIKYTFFVFFFYYIFS